jgi:hypothetical protein
MLDISVTAYGKSRPSGYEPLVFEETPAVRHPLDPPTLLSDPQRRIFESFLSLVPKADHAAFRNAVMLRLGSGRPGDAAVRSTCIAAAKAYLSIEELYARGLAPMPTRAKNDEAEE